MKELLLILLILPTLCFARSYLNYQKPSVSCLYDYETHEEFLKSCEYEPDVSSCAQIKYELEVCGEPSKLKEVEKIVKEREKAFQARQKVKEQKKAKAKQKENDCIDESAKALNDFSAKKIYSRCMKRKK